MPTELIDFIITLSRGAQVLESPFHAPTGNTDLIVNGLSLPYPSSAGNCYQCSWCPAGQEVTGCAECDPRLELAAGYTCGSCQTCASDHYRVVWGWNQPVKCQSCSSFAEQCAANHFLLGCGTAQTTDLNGYYQSSQGNCRHCDDSSITCPSANQYRVNCGRASKGTCTACPSCPGQWSIQKWLSGHFFWIMCGVWTMWRRNLSHWLRPRFLPAASHSQRPFPSLPSFPSCPCFCRGVS